MGVNSVLETVKSLRAEGSSDTALFEALSRRCLASAEEFFPPQIDELLTEFAALAYSDEALLQTFSGRLNDVCADASPRRVIRLLRNGAALRLPPGAWLDEVLDQLHRHVPNLQEGLPSALASLRLLGHRDEELAELLLTAGLLNSSELGPGFFTRLFEQWSLHGHSHSKALDQAIAIAGDHKALPDLRDGLNLLAGLWRCGAPEVASSLEEELAMRLQKATEVEVCGALTWMQRLSLRSPRLWELSVEAVELALPNQTFVRQHLPEALYALAALSPGKGAGAQKADQEGREVELVATLLGRAEVSATLPRYTASQVLQLFTAASLLSISCQGSSALEGRLAQSIPWNRLATQAARLSRQLSLPERRQLLAAARQAEDFCQRHDVNLDSQLKLHISEQHLPVVALPPLPAFMDEDAAAKAASSSPVAATLAPGTFEALWSPTSGDDRRGRSGVLYLGPRDIFVQSTKDVCIAPSCSLVARALELDGWHVTLHA